MQTGQRIQSNRLSTSGPGEGSPVAGNDTSTGRQQNRRVEVIHLQHGHGFKVIPESAPPG